MDTRGQTLDPSPGSANHPRQCIAVANTNVIGRSAGFERSHQTASLATDSVVKTAPKRLIKNQVTVVASIS